MTILSAAWVSPALHHPTIDPRPALILWGQRRAIATGRRANMLAFDISTRPDAPMTCWRSIDQLQKFNSEASIKEAIKTMSDYVAQKDDVVILNDGDTAKVQEVIKGGLLVLTTAGDEIKITQDDISGQLLNVEFKLANDAHIGSLTAVGIKGSMLPDWNDDLPELPADLWQAIETHYGDPLADPMTAADLAQLKAGDDDAVSVETDIDADPYNERMNVVDPAGQITKLQNALQDAKLQIGLLTEENRKLILAKEALEKVPGLPKADEVAAMRHQIQTLTAENERLKNQKPAPAAATSEQGFLPYFREQISTPEQADRAGRKLAALRAEGWKIRHEQFIQDGKLVYHIARLEMVDRKPSPDYLQERAAVPVAVPASPLTVFGTAIPGSPSTFNPANNSAPGSMVIIGLEDDKSALNPFEAALKAGITDPDTLRQIGDQQLIQVAQNSYQRHTTAPVSRRPFTQVRS